MELDTIPRMITLVNIFEYSRKTGGCVFISPEELRQEPEDLDGKIISWAKENLNQLTEQHTAAIIFRIM